MQLAPEWTHFYSLPFIRVVFVFSKAGGVAAVGQKEVKKACTIFPVVAGLDLQENEMHVYYHFWKAKGRWTL